MKTNSWLLFQPFAGIIPAAAGLLIASGAQAQNLFVSAWQGDGNIFQFTPGGTQSTFDSGLGTPTGLAFDTAGDLFSANRDTGAITEYQPDGTKSIFAYSDGGFGLAFDSAGNLYQSDYFGGKIDEFRPNGLFAGTFAAGLNEPFSLAFNQTGDMFVSCVGGNIGNGVIYEYTPGGVQTTFATGLYEAFGLAFDHQGDLFEADGQSGKIYEFAPDGTKSTFATGLDDPFALAFGNNGNLFVADLGGTTGRIYEFTPDGGKSTFATGLNAPESLAFQPVPEPSACALLGIGITLLCVWQKKLS